MYKLKSVSINNVSPFTQIQVPLTKNDGLVIITGVNKDGRDKRQHRGLNNGSGKSMLLNTIANCRYGGPPTNDIKNSKKDMLHHRDSTIGMKFVDPNDNKIEFIQGQKNWNIIVNGQDLQVHTTKNQIAKMEELFPISESEFYAYTYVSSLQTREVHFQSAKPEARLKFLTSVFRLDDYDRMKKHFTQQLGLIKEEQIRFDVLEGKLMGVSANLSRINIDDDAKARYKKLNAKMDVLQKQLETVGAEHGDLLVRSVELKNRKKQIEKFNELKDKIAIFDLPQLKKLKAQAEAYSTYVSDMESYKENSSRLMAKLKELGSKRIDTAELEKELVAVDEEIDAVSCKLEELEAANTHYKRLKSKMGDIRKEINDLGFEDIKSIKFTKADEETLNVCKTTVQLKKLLDSDSGSNCPTCHQKVDKKKIAKSVKLAQSKVSELKTLLAASELLSKYRELKVQLGDYVPTNFLKKGLDAATKRAEKLRASIQRGHKIDSLLSSLKTLKKPKKCVKTEKRPSYYDVQIHLLREYELTSKELGTIETNIDKRIKKTLAKLSDVDTHRKELQQTFSKLSEKRTRMDSTLGEYKVLRRQQKEILHELEGVKPLLGKRDMYKALEKAWSSKGMKIDVANNIMSQLEDNLNKYSELLFPEPFEFKAYVNEKGVFCEVHRGRGNPVTDVRLMSGAESDAFKLLFLLSMLLIIEGDRRTNLVVLDEPDSHMDDVFRGLYVTRFIPFLREIVPHIFIVTPKNVSLYEDAEVWKIVKTNGVSKLITGELA